MGKYKDLSGQIFGRLTVIKFAGRNKHKQLLWECKCICGKVSIKRGYSLKCGETKSCGCLQKECLIKRNNLYKGEAALNNILHTYKKGAKRRNLEFSLNKKDFSNLINQNCFYCGVQPYRRTNVKNANGQYTYNGVDRINNKLGYTISNCVPCCKICNLAKHSMSQNMFYAWIKRVYKHTKGKTNE